MEKHLVLAGGGHAHMLTLARLKRFTDNGIRVTVVQPSPHHYYSGMGPGMLGGFYRPEQIRFETRRTVETVGGIFVNDRITAVDPGRRTVVLASGGRLSYDALSLNIGSEVPVEAAMRPSPDVFPVKPISGLVEARDRFVSLASGGPVSVAVVGGGPSAVEVSGNLLGLARRSSLPPPNIRMFVKKTLLAGWRVPVVRRVRASLVRRGVEIFEESPVREAASGMVRLAGGPRYDADLVFVATGVQPPALIAESGLPTGEGGGLRVNEYLQSPGYPEIFGGGDCISFQSRQLDKVGVYAVRQNPVLLANLHAALTGGPLQPFDPGGGYLLILNMGDGTGVLQKGRCVFSGTLAFRLKDWIDRRFMHRFQQVEKG